jgi:hypothetical protein
MLRAGRVRSRLPDVRRPLTTTMQLPGVADRDVREMADHPAAPWAVGESVAVGLDVEQPDDLASLLGHELDSGLLVALPFALDLVEQRGVKDDSTRQRSQQCLRRPSRPSAGTGRGHRVPWRRPHSSAHAHRPRSTGKTRLALQGAGLASDAYPDGVYWIPLAPLRDPTLVLATAVRRSVEERPHRAHF